MYATRQYSGLEGSGDGRQTEPRYTTNTITELDLTDDDERFCLSWEVWATNLTEAVASGSLWPTPPAVPGNVSAAAARIAESAMTALATVWASEIEARKYQSQLEDIELRLGLGTNTSASSLPLQDQHDITKALLREEQEIRRLRQREADLSEKVAAARTDNRRLRERNTEHGEIKFEHQSAIMQAKAGEAEARQLYQDRSAEVATLRTRLSDLSNQAAMQDASIKTLKHELQERDTQLRRRQTSDRRRERLMTDLSEYVQGLEEQEKEFASNHRGVSHSKQTSR